MQSTTIGIKDTLVMVHGSLGSVLSALMAIFFTSTLHSFFYQIVLLLIWVSVGFLSVRTKEHLSLGKACLQHIFSVVCLPSHNGSALWTSLQHFQFIV